MSLLHSYFLKLATFTDVANSTSCFEYWLLIHFKPGINVFEPSQAEVTYVDTLVDRLVEIFKY